jgi:hypothetical protein
MPISARNSGFQPIAPQWVARVVSVLIWMPMIHTHLLWPSNRKSIQQQPQQNLNTCRNSHFRRFWVWTFKPWPRSEWQGCFLSSFGCLWSIDIYCDPKIHPTTACLHAHFCLEFRFSTHCPAMGGKGGFCPHFNAYDLYTSIVTLKSKIHPTMASAEFKYL